MARVILVAYSGAQGLDIFGPAEVFALAGERVVVTANRATRITTTSGITLQARALASLALRRDDTVLVVGGPDPAIRAAVADRALIRFVARAARLVRRIGSVCSGTFVLAAAGILDGHRAATHWSACDQLAAYRPAIRVDRDAIYVREGNLWTSAGVTTGIDMALAMVEDDHGRELADTIAGRLVLHARRPGFQSQWSAALVAQHDTVAPLGRAIDWLRAHLREPIDITVLARHAAMSPRTLHRRCLESTHLTPRRLIEKLRVEEARLLVATTQLPAKSIAARCGFADAGQMARAFRRTLGLVPSQLRLVRGTESTYATSDA